MPPGLEEVHREVICLYGRKSLLQNSFSIFLRTCCSEVQANCYSAQQELSVLIGIHTTESWWRITNNKILNVQPDLLKLLTCIQVTNTQQFSLELQRF